ncbi:DUF4282 domain-containing protein [Corticibacter populi]|uniref:DUF4282 domain-containing protein n=1 Tax=Corticibacter populi TaxID=1550736 RepID=A0A3M6QYK5_9BURK|nr:DUF4282 domain-containing protein [Corticibacter populi]RMX08078.1 DUF4282 domain-containing protein [Corticibacter populi]RZS35326.1 uncharacterized protein DUF4282 [Corticibacter populi]
MRQFLYFDTMLAPKLITVVYWLQLVLYLFSGVVAFFGAMVGGRGFLGTISGMVGAVILTFLACLFARILAEVLIVIFKINDNIKKIADRSGS